MRFRYVCIALFIYLFALPHVLVADDYYIEWADTLDNGDWDGAFSVAVDNSNNIIVTGISYIGGNNDYFIVKYDCNGTILWQDTIDNGDEDYADCVAVDNSNNIIVTGYCTIGGDYDYFTVKYDSNGTILWQDTLDNNGLYDIARGVAVDNSNNIIVTGYCDIGNDCVYLTVKYDSSGTIIWADTLNYGPWDSALDVAVDNDNNIIVTGYTSTGANNDYFTVKYDSSGTILWQDTIDNHEFDQAYGVAVDNSNNIIVTGCSGEPFSDYDYLTVKYDPNGTILWQDTFDNNDHDDVAYSVAVDNGNNIIVTGYSLELLGDYDYFTVKYDSNGTIVWQGTLDNGNNDIAHGVAVDNADNIIITGKSHIDGNFDYFTVKYVPVPGIAEDEYFDLLSDNPIFYIYPNPFNEKTEIRWQVTDNGYQIGDDRFKLEIYDINGRMIKEFNQLTNHQSPINHTTWDGTDSSNRKLPSGVYFLKFEIEGYTETEKLLLIR
ncbi:MAG: T9SS type A sorting domain-containing protein [candidate division WOR-3 bacterium]|nr:MAG: T9SS type A sorting domain-containing protein [candidate division WOR-3 bacterium]